MEVQAHGGAFHACTESAGWMPIIHGQDGECAPHCVHRVWEHLEDPVEGQLLRRVDQEEEVSPVCSSRSSRGRAFEGRRSRRQRATQEGAIHQAKSPSTRWASVLAQDAKKQRHRPAATMSTSGSSARHRDRRRKNTIPACTPHGKRLGRGRTRTVRERGAKQAHHRFRRGG